MQFPAIYMDKYLISSECDATHIISIDIISNGMM